MSKKKIIFCVLLILISVKIFPQTMTLDKSIETVANRIIEQILLRNIPEVFDFSSSIKTITVAILDFDCSSNVLSEYVSSDLTKYFLRNMRFTVVDRQNLDRARKELNFNKSSEVSEETAQGIGHFVGAQVVVFGSIKPLGNMYRMQARAITVEKAVVLAQEGINISKRDIEKFTGNIGIPNSYFNNAKRNYLEFISGNVQFGDDLFGYGGSLLIGGHVSPFPFASLGLETRLGKLNDEFYGSASPMFGLVIPFNRTVKIYGDAIIELGHFGSLEGRINNWVTPAFDAGILFWFDEVGFDLKYRGTWYKDTYTHSIGVGFITHPKMLLSAIGDFFGLFAYGVNNVIYNVIDNNLTIFGYTYSPGLPIGFSLGFFGIYTSLGFALPDLSGYQTSSSSSGFYELPETEQRYEIIDWVLGYNFPIIPKRLYLPVGVGTEAVRELRLYSYLIGGIGDYGGSGTVWKPAPQWETNILLEVGLLLRPTSEIEFGYDKTFSPYIYGTYRYIMSNKHTFSIGGGISFEKQ